MQQGRNTEHVDVWFVKFSACLDRIRKEKLDFPTQINVNLSITKVRPWSVDSLDGGCADSISVPIAYRIQL